MKKSLYLLVFIIFSKIILAASVPTVLSIESKVINVNGKNKVVYTIVQPNGVWGYYGVKGESFNVIVKNNTDTATGIHWHGLILPNNQDGVPGVTQSLIPPHGEYHYNYKLVQAGTYWMHSHVGLQAQDLMSAPFIISDPNEPNKSNKDVVVMFQDFTFKNPEQVMADLKKASNSMSDMKGMNADKPDLNDVEYDAYLTNYHTLAKPQIVTVEPNSVIRLRFINGSAGTNYWINLGGLSGKAIAFDGANIRPMVGSLFQLAMGQRIDVLITVPNAGGAFPIIGQVEGLKKQTGLILKTPNTQIPEVSTINKTAMPALNYKQEYTMQSTNPLIAKPIKKVVQVTLSGNMQKYIWMINGKAWPNTTPINLTRGDRVEIIFNNQSNMAHPMHLHGHIFEIVEIDGHKLTNAALHDTILVLPHSTVKVVFDADQSGKWALHCHMAYHMQAGMFTVVNIKPGK